MGLMTADGLVGRPGNKRTPRSFYWGCNCGLSNADLLDDL